MPRKLLIVLLSAIVIGLFIYIMLPTILTIGWFKYFMLIFGSECVAYTLLKSINYVIGNEEKNRRI